MHWYPLETRTIQRYGIRIEHLDYYSDALAWLVRNRKDHGKVQIRRHPFDVRVVYVRHPNRRAEAPDAVEEEEWIAVPVRQLGFPIASIHELRSAKREALRRKRQPTPDLLARIIDEQQLHVEEATRKTRTARRQAARKSHHDRLRDEADRAGKRQRQTGPVAAEAARPKPQPGNPPRPAPRSERTLPEQHPDDGSLAAILATISDDDLDATFG